MFLLIRNVLPDNNIGLEKPLNLSRKPSTRLELFDITLAIILVVAHMTLIPHQPILNQVVSLDHFHNPFPNGLDS